MTCILCQPLKADEVYSSNHWRIVVNINQNKLGKVMVCLNRHDEDICDLSEEEVRDLWGLIRWLKSALTSCFQPNHFNYSFLMNQDRHVHLHVIPRYRETRAFAGVQFEDSDHITQRRPPEHAHRELVTVLRKTLEGN